MFSRMNLIIMKILRKHRSSLTHIDFIHLLVYRRTYHREYIAIIARNK